MLNANTIHLSNSIVKLFNRIINNPFSLYTYTQGFYDVYMSMLNVDFLSKYADKFYSIGYVFGNIVSKFGK